MGIMRTRVLVHLISVISLTFQLLETAAGSSLSMAKPGCAEKCGNITVPYPFGMGAGCYLDKPFEVICNNTLNSTFAYAPFLERNVSKISFDYVRVNTWAYPKRHNKSETGILSVITYDWGQYFSHPHTENKLITVGCDIFGYITDAISNNGIISGCVSFCNGSTSTLDGPLSNLSSCSGFGCCQATIPKDLASFNLLVERVKTLQLSSNIPNPPSDVVAFLAEKNFSELDISDIYNDGKVFYVPALLNWAIGNISCGEAQAGKDYACGNNSYCTNSTQGRGYRCNCFPGYQGNPYLTGCQDIDECEDPNNNVCQKEAQCFNTPGSYYCTCRRGYRSHVSFISNSSDYRYGCVLDKRERPLAEIVSLGIGITAGVLILIAIGVWLYRYLEKRKKNKMKQNFFKRNGGMLLQQQISSNNGSVVNTKLFITEELVKATDNFNDSRVLGKGGLGTVYKGMLPDGSIVAVKKSNIVEENQVGQFINEVIILSQINHRNIVKLLGCCLETEVPLLVYEYVSNGTLSHHLHDEGYGTISWNNRLRIAGELAGALAYLHSFASTAIYHRDIKSSNILLGENYRAIVSDFGLSRSVPINKTHLTTMVGGTFGYMDPEYFRSGQFTDKSDVYAFGVVLAELLTGKKALSSSELSLVIHFQSAMKENRLLDIVETLVMKEGQKEEIVAVAKLAKGCLKLNAKKRPSMKEISADLDRLRRIQEQPLLVRNCPEEYCSITEPSYLYTTDDHQLRSIHEQPLLQQNCPEEYCSISDRSYFDTFGSTTEDSSRPYHDFLNDTA